MYNEVEEKMFQCLNKYHARNTSRGAHPEGRGHDSHGYEVRWVKWLTWTWAEDKNPYFCRESGFDRPGHKALPILHEISLLLCIKRSNICLIRGKIITEKAVET
jgi:hypothetical protein